MSRGVALPPERHAILPTVWAEIAAEHGPVAALARIEEAAAHASAQADKLEVQGNHQLSGVYRSLASAFERDARFFVEVHA